MVIVVCKKVMNPVRKAKTILLVKMQNKREIAASHNHGLILIFIKF